MKKMGAYQTEPIFLQRDNNVEVRYVINEAIKFKPAESGSGGSGSSGSGSRRSQIVNYAIQFVGNPYVWGGTSLTNGVDCSGFTMKVMQKFEYRFLTIPARRPKWERRSLLEI